MRTPIGAILVFVYLLAAFVAFAAGDPGESHLKKRDSALG